MHSDTAQAMRLAIEYTERFDPALERTFQATADRLFRADTDCDTAAEPRTQSDFLSPCLMQAAIMSRLLDRAVFLEWIDTFLPPLHSVAFRPLTEPLGPGYVEGPGAQLSARSHIVGLNFWRAWSMQEVANALRPDDPRVPVLRRLAAIQAERGFAEMGAVGYVGTHYYATFALLYLIATTASP